MTPLLVKLPVVYRIAGCPSVFMLHLLTILPKLKSSRPLPTTGTMSELLWELAKRMLYFQESALREKGI